MANLKDLPVSAWFGVAGALAFAGAAAIPNRRTRVVLTIGGTAAIGVGIALGFAQLLELFGLKTPPRIEDVEREEIADPNAGSSYDNRGDDGGLIGGFIESPSENTKVSRSSFFGGTYPVDIAIASSKLKPETMRVRLVSDERYSFGGNESRATDLGVLVIPPGTTTRMRANVDAAANGIVNPYFPPEVALTLELDGKPVDVARFAYS